MLYANPGWRAVWCPNHFWAPGAQKNKIFLAIILLFSILLLRINATIGNRIRRFLPDPRGAHSHPHSVPILGTRLPIWAPGAQLGTKPPYIPNPIPLHSKRESPTKKIAFQYLFPIPNSRAPVQISSVNRVF